MLCFVLGATGLVTGSPLSYRVGFWLALFFSKVKYHQCSTSGRLASWLWYNCLSSPLQSLLDFQCLFSGADLTNRRFIFCIVLPNILKLYFAKHLQYINVKILKELYNASGCVSLHSRQMKQNKCFLSCADQGQKHPQADFNSLLDFMFCHHWTKEINNNLSAQCNLSALRGKQTGAPP